MTSPSDVEPPVAGIPAISPYLVVVDLGAALQFYVSAFGFVVESTELGADGRPFHAVLGWKGARIQLGPENSDEKAPRTRGGASMHHYVESENVDVLFDRALDAGAAPLRSPRNEYWGARCCLVADPDGHLWMFATPIPQFNAWRETKKQLAESMKDPSE